MMNKIKDVYPNGYYGDGIFTDLETHNVPWKNEDIATQLNVAYYARSGDKSCSPLINNRMRLQDDWPTLNEQSRAVIASTVFELYKTQWNKLYATLSLVYNPIENYRMTENEEIERTNNNTEEFGGTVTTESTNSNHEYGQNLVTNNLSETDTGTIQNAGTKTTNEDSEITIDNDVSNTGTETTAREADNKRYDEGTIENSGSDSNTNSIYGFNSNSDVNSNASSGSNSNVETRDLMLTDDIDDTETKTLNTTTATDNTETRDISITDVSSNTETHNLTKANTGTVKTEPDIHNDDEIETTETRNLENTYELNESITRDFTRSGNIGVTTTQQLIESERSVSQWSFFERVFKDIDYMLCLDVYDYSECEVY